jgi:hypothetical protein
MVDNGFMFLWLCEAMMTFNRVRIGEQEEKISVGDF